MGSVENSVATCEMLHLCHLAKCGGEYDAAGTS